MGKPKKQPQRLSFGRTRQERSGRWSAAYRHHGVMHRPADTFPSKQSAVSWLDNERHLIELDRITPGTWMPPAQRAAALAAATLTFEEYASKWLTQRAVSRRTRDNYDYLLNRHILPVLGPAVLVDITPDNVREWFAGLGTTYLTRNARAYGVLTAVFNTAVDDGLIARSPARITGASSVKHRRSVVLLEPEQLAQLADKMPEQLRLAVLLGGWCGLRRGEVFALTRADIGKDAATVTIDKAVTYRNREYVCGPTKTVESNRTVTVPPHLRPLIKDHLARHTGKTRDALLFPDPVSGSFYAEGPLRPAVDLASPPVGVQLWVMVTMGTNNRGVCQRCGHERALESNGQQCRPCGRAERAKNPKRTPPRKPPEPEKRVVWPPETGSWGRCPECATGVALRDDGMTVKHKHGDSAKWNGIGPRCPGSDSRPTHLVEPPPREVQVPDQPERVRDREFLSGNEIPAGLPGLGRKRK